MAQRLVTLPPALSDDEARAAASEIGYDADGWLNTPLPCRVASAAMSYIEPNLADPSKPHYRNAHVGAGIAVAHRDDLIKGLKGRCLVAPDGKVPGEWVEVPDVDTAPSLEDLLTDDDLDDDDDLVLNAGMPVDQPPASADAPPADPDEDGDDEDELDPALVDLVRNGNVATIIAEAGDDPSKAKALLDIEAMVAAQSQREPRKTLVADLARLVGEAPDPADANPSAEPVTPGADATP